TNTCSPATPGSLSVAAEVSPACGMPFITLWRNLERSKRFLTLGYTAVDETFRKSHITGCRAECSLVGHLLSTSRYSGGDRPGWVRHAYDAASAMVHGAVTCPARCRTGAAVSPEGLSKT